MLAGRAGRSRWQVALAVRAGSWAGQAGLVYRGADSRRPRATVAASIARESALMRGLFGKANSFFGVAHAAISGCNQGCMARAGTDLPMSPIANPNSMLFFTDYR
jgi:hypothetical protein